MENLLSQSIFDLKEDFEELIYLYQDYHKKLLNFSKEIDQKKAFINSYAEIKKISATHIKELETIIHMLEKDLIKTSVFKNKKDLEYLQDQRNKYFDLIRIKTGIYSSLITSTDWQSPTFDYSLRSQAGRQTGKIVHTISDYKRDIHLDEGPYEKLFLKEYIEPQVKFNSYAYTVSSGMAAFTTILTFLITEQKISGKILIGKSIYFQNKEIIERFFPNKVIEIDENNYEKLINEVNKNKPSIIILDTICNSHDLAMPNLTMIIDFLNKNVKNDTYLIIDNTSVPIYFQPLKLMKGKNKHLSLFILESLNKYHQFGMDRVTGGIIIAQGKDTIKIYYSRQNSGTNISDISVNALPLPNKLLLKKRLMRFERNASFLTEQLQEFIDNNKTSIEKVIYPGLHNHPASTWNESIKFHGSYFSLKFISNKNNPKNYKKFIKKLIENAKRENMQIAVGTSFGFNNTRIYLTSLRSDYGTPFLRISVGTENRIEIEKIKDIFIKTISTF